jgi:hypothetical protein
LDMSKLLSMVPAQRHAATTQTDSRPPLKPYVSGDDTAFGGTAINSAIAVILCW